MKLEQLSLEQKQSKLMNKPKIIYVTDAMCGWCYVFGNVMSEIQTEFENDFDFIAISGGMIVGDRIGPISEMAEFIKSAYPRVEQYTGVKFGEDYVKLLDEGTYMANSIKPAIALNAFKSYLPLKSVEFSHDLQYAHFYQGKNINEKEAILEITEQYGINATEFVERMNDDRIHQLTFQEFEYVKKAGITGFPAVLCESEKGVYMVSSGYRSLEDMRTIINATKDAIKSDEVEM